MYHDHWLLMALNELYRYRQKEIYIKRALMIAESIVYAQRNDIGRPCFYEPWRGSYYSPPRSTPNATRMEGLVAAYMLAGDFGYDDLKEKIIYAIELGIKFQLKTQFTEHNSHDFPNPDFITGAFHSSPYHYDIRIDYVQHNLSSIIGYYLILGNS
jgi:hypothetical protein